MLEPILITAELTATTPNGKDVARYSDEAGGCEVSAKEAAVDVAVTVEARNRIFRLQSPERILFMRSP